MYLFSYLLGQLLRALKAEVRRATVSAAACWATPPNSPSLLLGVAQVLPNAGVCGDLSASVARPSVRDVTKISANEGEVGASRRLLPQLFNILNNSVRLACVFVRIVGCMTRGAYLIIPAFLTHVRTCHKG